jgi:hypothetical protein
MLALQSSKRLALTGLCAAGVVLISSGALAQDDPPPEAGRISYVSGNVSIQPITADEWGQAYPNLPVGPGDRIFTDNDGRAEIQVGQTYVRIGPNSDVTLVDDSQFNINFGIAQGSIRLHSFGLWPRQLLDISTPNGNAEFANSGDLRIDVLPNDGATVFTNLGQFADITAAGDFRQELDYGQSLQLSGSNPVYPQWLQPNGPDDLDSWSQQRDQQFSRTAAFQYVSPDTPGAADLDASGDWQPQTEYGAVWFPRNVSADWEPYHNGHWISRDPWGWVWVEDESWGYAPFHYGRWVHYHDRWGWVPGPVNVRPVWSPALVVFAGGGGGVGLSAWFPLGPGEAYHPWYRCSPRYVDRVNITNIRESPRVHVQNTYVNVVNVTNVTYVNKTYVTAVRQQDFTSGHSVRNVAVRVDPREVEQMRALQQPVVAPPSRVIINRPVAHPVPVSIQRPMLINQQGKQIAARPNATPVAAPVRQMPAPRPIAGRVVVAPPQRPMPNRPNGNQFPGQGQGEQRPVPPPSIPNVPRANPVKPVAPMQGVERGITTPPNNYPQQPNQPNNQQPQQPNPQQPERPNQPNYQQGRPNQPNNPQPNRPNYQQPNQPTPQQPNPQQPERPNQPNYQQERPNQPNNPQPNRPNNQQPNQPTPQQPNPHQNPPRENQNRQDFGPVQPSKHVDSAPPPQPQSRPAPPPRDQERPAPPPRDQGQPAPPPRQQDKPNKNNKDQKKNDKKEDKKPD